MQSTISDDSTSGKATVESCVTCSFTLYNRVLPIRQEHLGGSLLLVFKLRYGICFDTRPFLKRCVGSAVGIHASIYVPRTKVAMFQMQRVRVWE